LICAADNAKYSLHGLEDSVFIRSKSMNITSALVAH